MSFSQVVMLLFFSTTFSSYYFIFYILSSGKYVNERLFISSNSSFTACVNFHFSTQTINTDFHSNDNSDSPDNSIQGQSFVSQNCTRTSGTHTFIECSWDNEDSGQNGCGIYYVLSSPDSTSSLTVRKCAFSNCHSSGSVAGGAIYACNISSAYLYDSFFFQCSCGTSNYMEGGGVLLGCMQFQPFIRGCLFLCCTSPDDGAGYSVWYSNSATACAIDSCRFIRCKGTDPSQSEGGGVILCSNTDFITCTNCLFCACEAQVQGGGIYLSCPSGATVTPITFCFFRENKSNAGRDVHLRVFPSDEEAIAHSFSSESAR